MMNSAIGLINVVLGVVLRAAKNATGNAITIPNNVPSVAILMVSQIGLQSDSK